MKKLPGLETEMEWELESECPLLVTSAPGAKVQISNVACAAWLGRVVEWPQERGVSTRERRREEAGERKESESWRPRVFLDVAVGAVREKRRARKHLGPETESEWESEPAEQRRGCGGEGRAGVSSVVEGWVWTSGASESCGQQGLLEIGSPRGPTGLL